MSYLIDLILAVGLSMDSFAVSMSSSTTIRPFKVTDAIKIATFFGVIQALMLVIGWLGGSAIRSYLSAYAQLIASGILVLIGIKMIYEAYRNPKGKMNTLDYSVLLMLAIATSIDALVAGISFTFLDVFILEPAIIVGCVTFILSFCGAIIGYRTGHFFEYEVEIFGGLILIGLGIRSLILIF
jgi:manganese efflux pump family protein